MQLHVEKGRRLALFAFASFARDGDQGAKRVKHLLRLRFVRSRQCALQAAQHCVEVRWLGIVQHPQQVHEGGVFAQPLAEPGAPAQRLEIPFGRFAEEQLVLGADVVLRRAVAVRVHPLRKIRCGREVGTDDGILQKLVDALAHFTDHGACRKGLAKDSGRIAEHILFVLLPADRGRCAHADQPLVRLQPGAQAADEAGEVRPLSAIEGVQFIHHQKAQGSCGVVPPQRKVDGPGQQQIEHLVVGEQDVRWLLPQHVAVLNKVVRRHALAAQCAPFADVQSGRHPAVQGRCVVNDVGDASGLVGSERVHGIDEDGLDARLACMGAAVLKNRIEEALSLAGTRARGHDGGLPPCQPAKRHALMSMRRVAEGDFRKRLAAFRGRLKGQVKR